MAMETGRSTLAGVAMMVGAMAVLPFLDVVAKTLGQQGVPVLQIVWARMAMGTLMTIPLALRVAGPRGLLPERLGVHSLRAALLIAATFCFFFALKFLPIADALAVFFVNPLVITALSPVILGERVGPRRWAAVAVGFVGTLIIIRPGFQAFNPGMGLALAAGCCLALYFLLTRRIAGRDDAMVTTFRTSLLGTVMVSAVVWLVWQAPTPEQWLLFLALGVTSTLGHGLIVMAYDRAEASLLAPLAYTEMVMAVILGWWFFGDFPDGWTFFGVSVLIGCALYISARERVVKQGGA
ncbi:Threonine/homoserine efflux transporter RhtA [Gemmobacter aquatilis]|uniref:Threonine/homoserine efflux transporter RhtA n=1 Tax=Gemmobacter aquatilis TaxID=933059 RepID=A0A1H8K012_9RHOB|nr:DMT family transporter [Gemmobacter aquatilis]SEN86135.1 Threonine/homoserine efflux transporter RhtA [Gemmobacter aquatilis]